MKAQAIKKNLQAWSQVWFSTYEVSYDADESQIFLEEYGQNGKSPKHNGLVTIALKDIDAVIRLLKEAKKTYKSRKVFSKVKS